MPEVERSIRRSGSRSSWRRAPKLSQCSAASVASRRHAAVGRAPRRGRTARRRAERRPSSRNGDAGPPPRPPWPMRRARREPKDRASHPARWRPGEPGSCVAARPPRSSAEAPGRRWPARTIERPQERCPTRRTAQELRGRRHCERDGLERLLEDAIAFQRRRAEVEQQDDVVGSEWKAPSPECAQDLAGECIRSLELNDLAGARPRLLLAPTLDCRGGGRHRDRHEQIGWLGQQRPPFRGVTQADVALVRGGGREEDVERSLSVSREQVDLTRTKALHATHDRADGGGRASLRMDDCRGHRVTGTSLGGPPCRSHAMGAPARRGPGDLGGPIGVRGPSAATGRGNAAKATRS